MAISAKMGSRRSKRLVSAGLALLFLFAGAGDAWGVHHCLHHDGPTPAATTGSEADHQHGAAAKDADHGPCTCVGRCHAGVAPTIADSGAQGTLPVPPAPPAAARSPQPLLRVALTPFSLPWSNAPPTL